MDNSINVLILQLSYRTTRLIFFIYLIEKWRESFQSVTIIKFTISNTNF
jgi:hypothetical protein